MFEWTRMYWPIAVLGILWLSSHVAIIFFARRNPTSEILAIVMAIALLSAYILKPSTYDLPKYSNVFDLGTIGTKGIVIDDQGVAHAHPEEKREGEPFCPFARQDSQMKWFSSTGYCLYSQVFGKLLPSGSYLPRLIRDNYVSDSLVISTMIIGLVLIILVIYRIVSKESTLGRNKIRSSALLLTVVLGSVFFLIGTQNSIRQFLGIAFILLALTFLRDKRYITATVLALVGFSMHKWAFIFLIIGLIVGGAVIIENRKVYTSSEHNSFLTEVCALGCGIIAVIIFKVLLFWQDGAWLPGDAKQYILNIVGEKDPQRVNAWVKSMAIFSVFILSESILGKRTSGIVQSVRKMRRGVFLLAGPMVIFPEVFSRLIVFYFALEMVLIACIFEFGNRRARIAGAVVFCSYGVAPNALNVLIGPGNWLPALYG